MTRDELVSMVQHTVSECADDFDKSDAFWLLAEIGKAGLAIVPITPTEEMMFSTKIPFSARGVWEAMVEKGRIA